MHLTSITDRIVVNTDAAEDVDIYTAWRDHQAGGETLVPGRNATSRSTSGNTTAVPSPRQGDSRVVEHMSITAPSTNSGAVGVAVAHTDGTTAVTLAAASLTPGQSLRYSRDAGFAVSSDGVAAPSPSTPNIPPVLPSEQDEE